MLGITTANAMKSENQRRGDVDTKTSKHVECMSTIVRRTTQLRDKGDGKTRTLRIRHAKARATLLRTLPHCEIPLTTTYLQSRSGTWRTFHGPENHMMASGIGGSMAIADSYACKRLVMPETSQILAAMRPEVLGLGCAFKAPNKTL
jgi:hypothetical protein